MYSELVKIVVNGKAIIITVLCCPNMPQSKLKELAINTYLRREKQLLLRENGLSELKEED